jgi:hypothetical protein
MAIVPIPYAVIGSHCVIVVAFLIPDVSPNALCPHSEIMCIYFCHPLSIGSRAYAHNCPMTSTGIPFNH